MAKKKSVPSSESLVGSRPQRNMRAKVVFDPSDNNIPKRRNKAKSEKSNESKKSTVEKKKNHDSKSKINLTNESFESFSNEFLNISPVHSPFNSPVRFPSPEVILKVLTDCCICEKNLLKKELVNCPICKIKAHKDCLIVNEPMWKFKLDKCPWLCKQCRKKHCSECLNDEHQSEMLRRCITCKVGLHINCFESYDIKPLQKINIDMYICIPCMTLATQRVPEVEGDEELNDLQSPISLLTSDEDDDIKSIKSVHSSVSVKFSKIFKSKRPEIPTVNTWEKNQIYEYFLDRFPGEIASAILKYEIDGPALLLLKRADITLNMGLKLGPAMKFYKEVRILQTQSTHPSHYFE